MSWRQRFSRWDVKTAPYLYIAPFFLLFALVGLFPLLYTGWVALNKWSLITGNQGFIGLANFQYVLAQPRFWDAVTNTFSIFLLSSVPQIFLALGIAAVLNANLRAKTFWRMGVLVPYVVAPVAVSLVFGQLFADESGVFNAVLTSVGLDPIGWHSDRFWSHIAIATMVNFRWTGYNTLIFPRCDAGHSARRHRSCGGRRGQSLADLLQRHRPDAPANDHLRGDHLNDRWPANLR